MTGGNFFLWFIIAREVIIFEEPIFTATPNLKKKKKKISPKWGKWAKKVFFEYIEKLCYSFFLNLFYNESLDYVPTQFHIRDLFSEKGLTSIKRQNALNCLVKGYAVL